MRNFKENILKHLTHLTFILLFVTACGYAPPASQPSTSSQNPYGQNQYQQGPYNNQQPYNPQYQQQPYNPQYQQQPYAQQQGSVYDAYGTPGEEELIQIHQIIFLSTGGGNLPNERRRR